MNPSMHLFHKHLRDADVVIGAAKGQWGVVDEDPLYPTWPLVVMWVAAPPKPDAPERYYFRFDLSGYPTEAPTACLWNIEKNERLSFDKWPKGGPLVTSVFRPDWEGGNALYAPCDRRANLIGHSDWAHKHPDYYWQPHFTILNYLRFLYEIFDSGDYQTP